MSNSLSRRNTGKPQNRNAGVRWLLMVLALVAILVILLRMAEFSGHRIQHAPRKSAPGLPLP